MQPGYFSALFFSIVLHGLLLVFLTVSFALQQFSNASLPPPALAIQAAVVDESMIAAELAKLEATDKRIKAAEEQRQRDLDAQAEQARAQRQKEEERLAKLTRERKAAEQRDREQARQREQAERERVEREQREATERQAQAETEKKRLAELAEARIKEEQRLAAVAEQRKKEEAARQKAAREAALQADREEQLQRAIAEETARRDAEESGLLDEYRILIRQRIVRNWIQPPGALAGLKCELLLTQIPGGEVTDVQIVSCNGDAAVVRSIEAAVYKASPLPPPSDPRLFDRKVRVLFEPEN